MTRAGNIYQLSNFHQIMVGWLDRQKHSLTLWNHPESKKHTSAGEESVGKLARISGLLAP